MKLLIDIGNSRTKYVLFEQGKFSQKESIINQNLSLHWLENQCVGINEIVVANVGSLQLSNSIEKWAKINKIAYTKVISEKYNYGVSSIYQQPAQLGVDRWLGLIGAASLYGKKNILIIDSGTATTIDLLNSMGQHLGGWIIPGINMLRDSLALQTTNISMNQINNVDWTFGANTSDCVNNGGWAATLGCINMAIEQANKLLSVDLVLILGGNADVLASKIKYPVEVNQELIFYGLLKYSH